MIPAAWSDFAEFLATGVNVQRRADCEVADVLAPVEVAAMLDGLRLQAASGERAALWDALQACARYNVPLPYWLADALRHVDRELHAGCSSAHELLGLAARLPLSRSRGPWVRTKLRMARALWREVERQRRAEPGLGEGPAVERALKALKGFPMKQRAAIELLQAEQARVERALAPYRRARLVKRLPR